MFPRCFAAFVAVCDRDFLLFLAGTASVAFLVRGVCQEPRATMNDFRNQKGWLDRLSDRL